MEIKEALERVAKVLESLKAREHGRLEQLAATIGKRRSYITKLHKTGGYTFARLLAVLDLYREEPGSFFARAFDIDPDPDTYLRALLRPGREDAVLGRIEHVTRQIEHEPPPEGVPSPSRAVVENLTRSSRSDQSKRLRETKKFQTPRFLRLYLVYLDDLRYESPEDSAFLAETLVREVVDRVIASERERVDLQCRALGVYTSANRVLGKFPNAARALVLALEVARRHQLEEATADLLQRGAYLLHDEAQYQRALKLLSEAHIIYHDLDMTAELGRVQVDRGIMFGQQSNYVKSAAVFRRALELLPEYETRNRLSASHGIAIAHLQLGQLDAAEKSLNEGLPLGQRPAGSIVAKMIWLKGLICAKRGNHAAATRELYKALSLLRVCKTPLDAALVGLDLISSLLNEGKRNQALTAVGNMTVLTVRFRGNRVAESALVKLTEAGLHGRISQELVENTRENLKKAHRKRGASPECLSR